MNDIQGSGSMFETGSSNSGQTSAEKRFELMCGLTLAFFAAILAITDLGGSKYGDDEIMASNAKSNAYAWYQSKSIRQNLSEGQRDLLTSLVESGTIRSEHLESIRNFNVKLDQEIDRYKKEKNEILMGSTAVGKENWVQDVDGELGKVTGAKEWEQKLDVLGRAGDVFDLSLLFLQLCLVLGAVSLVLQQKKMKWAFYGAMVLLGMVGLAYSIQAFSLALTLG
jgi:hypothetical protein